MKQHQRILNYINENGFISSYMAAVNLGVSNLPQRVKELKAKGYPITARQKAHINRYGVKVHYNEYYLKEESTSQNNGSTAK